MRTGAPAALPAPDGFWEEPGLGGESCSALPRLSSWEEVRTSRLPPPQLLSPFRKQVLTQRNAQPSKVCWRTNPSNTTAEEEGKAAVGSVVSPRPPPHHPSWHRYTSLMALPAPRLLEGPPQPRTAGPASPVSSCLIFSSIWWQPDLQILNLYSLHQASFLGVQ